MAEYIEREAFVKYIRSREGNFIDDMGKGWSNGMAAAASICEKFPAAAVQPIVEGASHNGEQDVAPVVHGEWRRSEDGEFVCVNCKQVKVSHDMLSFFLSTKRWNYCPNCGAKMDGVTFRQNRLLQPTGMTVAKNCVGVRITSAGVRRHE